MFVEASIQFGVPMQQGTPRRRRAEAHPGAGTGAGLRTVEESALPRELTRSLLRSDQHGCVAEGALPQALFFGTGWLSCLWSEADQLTAESEESGPASIREKAELADAHEAAGKNMLSKAAEELRRFLDFGLLTR